MPDNSLNAVRVNMTRNISNTALSGNPIARIQALIKSLDLELLQLKKPLPTKQNQSYHTKSIEKRPHSERQYRKLVGHSKELKHNVNNSLRNIRSRLKSNQNTRVLSRESFNQMRNTPKSSLNNIYIKRTNSYHLGSINRNATQLKAKYSKNNNKRSYSTSRLSQISVSGIGHRIFLSSLKKTGDRSVIPKISNSGNNIQRAVPRNLMVNNITRVANNTSNNFVKLKGRKKQLQSGPLKLKGSFTKTIMPTITNCHGRYTVIKDINSRVRGSLNRMRLYGGSQSKESLDSRARVNFRSQGDNLNFGNNTTVPVKTLSSAYRSRVIDAFRNRRIFMVIGNYATIRRALLKRGWLEKLTPNRYPRLQTLNEDVLLQMAQHGNEYEAVLISKIINHFPAFFIWQPRGHRDLFQDVQPYRNRIRRNNTLDFTTKVGLIGCAEQQQWYRQEGLSHMLYPRFFRLGGAQQEQNAFVDEFRMTQCYSLLRHICRHFKDSDTIVDNDSGSVSSRVIQFAYDRVKRQIDNWENVNALDEEQPLISDNEWNDFLLNSSPLLNYRGKLKCTYKELGEHVKKVKPLLEKLEEMRPDFKFDGCRNLWILKPGYQCRGLNIIIRNNLEEILSHANSHNSRRYIVQKYIEQPLLIYRTKFDIRQYMLLYIRESVIQIWLYRDCYLRFSSQEYNLDDLREVIHLTNNSVQKKYKNKTARDPRLPKNNMWPLEQFKSFISKQNVPDNIWDTRVYPGFKENLIAVVLASLDETTLCENCFELYGCDFMLDEQYNPILIEINATPDLTPSTEVTARICPQALQDLIKVVVDLPRNRNASTGLFQLVYEVNYTYKTDLNLKDTLNVHGKAMSLYRKERFKDKFVKKVKKYDNDVKQQKQEHQQQQQQQVQQKPKVQQQQPKVQQQQKKHQQKATKNVKKPTVPVKMALKKVSSPAKIFQTPLRAATKESLAIQYSMPK